MLRRIAQQVLPRGCGRKARGTLDDTTDLRGPPCDAFTTKVTLTLGVLGDGVLTRRLDVRRNPRPTNADPRRLRREFPSAAGAVLGTPELAA